MCPPSNAISLSEVGRYNVLTLLCIAESLRADGPSPIAYRPSGLAHYISHIAPGRTHFQLKKVGYNAFRVRWYFGDFMWPLPGLPRRRYADSITAIHRPALINGPYYIDNHPMYMAPTSGAEILQRHGTCIFQVRKWPFAQRGGKATICRSRRTIKWSVMDFGSAYVLLESADWVSPMGRTQLQIRRALMQFRVRALYRSSEAFCFGTADPPIAELAPAAGSLCLIQWLGFNLMNSVALTPDFCDFMCKWHCCLIKRKWPFFL